MVTQTQFQGKDYWALILGGSSGLGLASAEKLAAAGMNLVVVHQDTGADLSEVGKKFDALRKFGSMVISFNFNLTDESKTAAVLDLLQETLGASGKIRCLLHSIAKGNLKPAVPPSHLSNSDLSNTMQNMAFSLYQWTVGIFARNLFSRDARVISFTSEGSSRVLKNYGAVAAAKASLEALTRQIATEYAAFGIRANCIQAGVTDTKSLRRIPGFEAVIEHTLHRNPFNRLTLPEDVAAVVYLLCLDEAAWINGTVIPVDGGEHLS